MDSLLVTFPASGVTTWIFIPPLVAFVISFFTSMGGVSGAFMLLPFQVSAFGYTAPSVSATNQVFNIVAIPSGVWRYMKEHRMVWPLTWAVIMGTLPGVCVGSWVRVKYLPDPKHFKLFVGLILLYVAFRLLMDSIRRANPTQSGTTAETQVRAAPVVTGSRLSFRRIEFEFAGQKHSFSLPGVLMLCLVVGVAGGAYGIGGGSIVAPFLVTLFKLPIHVVAGAALMGTFVTSAVAVAAYHALSLYYPGVSIAPDWLLGISFGVGGSAGMYLGARCQKFVPARSIKLLLCACVSMVALRYIGSILSF